MDKFFYNNKELAMDKGSLLCAIINVTPDSFSDGGEFFGKDKAVERAMEMVEAGAQWLDIGAESTRPGSTYVEIQEEIDRAIPVIEEIKKRTDVPLSIDTWKAPVAQAAIEAGVDIINDITGLMGDPDMARVVGQSDAGYILMFNPVIARPDNPGSKIFPKFGDNPFSQEDLKRFESMDIIDLMDEYFSRGLAMAEKAGIGKKRIMLDPGIGFGMTRKENLEIFRAFDKYEDYFTFVGVSRKRFVVATMEEAGFNMDADTEQGYHNRDLASSYLTSLAALKGANVLRVHDVRDHMMANIMGNAVRMADDQADENLKQYK